jgi:hypothetical protein
MADEASVRDWLEGNCPHVWLLLNSRARRQLPPGFLEYLSPPSEEQLDKILPWNAPPLPPPHPSIAQERQRHAEQRVREGRQHLREADEFVKRLINVCEQKTVEHVYRRDLSGVHTGDQLAEYLCEIAFCAAISALSSTPPRLRPPSGRPGRDTHCDVWFQIAGIPMFAEVKRFPDPWLREPGAKLGREELRPTDLYDKLCDVPKQFPEGTVNLVFVYHASLDPQEGQEVLEQALFGWREDRLRPASPESGPQKEAGLFAHEEWRDISGCCLCRVRDGEVRVLRIWENPRANVPLPLLVHSALSRTTV